MSDLSLLVKKSEEFGLGDYAKEVGGGLGLGAAGAVGGNLVGKGLGALTGNKTIGELAPTIGSVLGMGAAGHLGGDLVAGPGAPTNSEEFNDEAAAIMPGGLGGAAVGGGLGAGLGMLAAAILRKRYGSTVATPNAAFLGAGAGSALGTTVGAYPATKRVRNERIAKKDAQPSDKKPAAKPDDKGGDKKPAAKPDDKKPEEKDSEKTASVHLVKKAAELLHKRALVKRAAELIKLSSAQKK